MDTTEKLLLTPREAAAAMGMSTRKLWSMTFDEKPGLPYVRLGRLVRYGVDDLKKWLADRTKGRAGE